jgi:GT2 family glycosyltransferase
MLDVSIIIVNWNSTDYVRECVQSIYDNATALTVEVIVVDNASTDNGINELVQLYPGLKLYKLLENAGFSRANNAGSTIAQGKALLFLNPDTKVLGCAIRDMWQGLRTLPQAGLVGCKLLNSDLSIQTSCIQRFPTVLNQIFDIDILKRISGTARLSGTYPLFQEKAVPTEVEVVSGACLMIRRDAFEQVGMFSTDYFMYAEDVDLSYEVRRLGLKNYYIPSATVIHYGGGSSRKRQANQWAAVMQRNSLLRFCLKKRGRHYANLYRVSVAFTACVRIALVGAAYLLSFPPRVRRELASVLRKWWAILRWSLGRSPVSSQ